MSCHFVRSCRRDRKRRRDSPESRGVQRATQAGRSVAQTGREADAASGAYGAVVDGGQSRAHLRKAPGATEAGICALDARGGDATDRARIWAREIGRAHV